MRKHLTALALASALPAMGCTASDAWTGPDKTKHLAAGFAAGSVGTLVFKDPHKGFLTSVAVAGLKEAYDAAHSDRHTCSFQDFAVTVAGGAAGAYGTAWFLAPRKGGVALGYVGTFR